MAVMKLVQRLNFYCDFFLCGELLLPLVDLLFHFEYFQLFECAMIFQHDTMMYYNRVLRSSPSSRSRYPFTPILGMRSGKLNP